MGVSSFDTKLDISFAVDVSSRSCNRKATAQIPLRVCSGVLGSAPTWKRVSARDASVGVVPDGASSPFAASQASPVPTSGMSPVLLLICVAAPVRLVVLPFSVWVGAMGFSLILGLVDCSGVDTVGLDFLCAVKVFSCNVVCRSPSVATGGCGSGMSENCALGGDLLSQRCNYGIL